MHDAKHVLLVAMLRNCRDQSDPLRSLIILPVPQPNAIYYTTCTLCKKLYIGETGRWLDDRFREHLRDVEKDDKNASKPVAKHFNLPNHFNQHMAVCGLSLHQGSTESRKTLEQNIFFFKSALLILMVSMNAFHSTNLFGCFSHYQAPTNSIALSFCIYCKPHTTHNSSIRSDKGLTLETSAFESLYDGQFTLSTPLIKPNYLVMLPLMQHHSFFRNLPPL